MSCSRSAAALATVLVALSAARAEEPATPAAAATVTPPPDAGSASSPPATQEQVKTLAEEIRRLKLEIGIPDVEYRSYAGMGPAASKVYYAPKGLSLGGYGEVDYVDYLDRRTDGTDLHRVVLYAGYRFSPRIVFNAEIEFEHGGGEVGVEFAYLDFMLADAVRLRGGNMLVPLGFVNEMHEPPFFHGVFRPEVERNLIPSTWNDNGLGVYGEVAGVRYKAYLLTGLDALGPLEAKSWLRRARTGGAEAAAESFAGVVALAYDLGPATFGAGVYRGRAGQGAATAAGGKIRADVLLAEAHAAVAWKGLELRGLYAVGTLGDADLVSAELGLTGTAVIGSRVRGGYLEVAYQVLAALAPGSDQGLLPFVRWEAMNLHDRVPAGGVADPALDTTTWTAGIGYKPIPTVVAKADYQRKTSAAPGASAAEQVNLGLGFVF